MDEIHAIALSTSEIKAILNNDAELKEIVEAILECVCTYNFNYSTKEKALHLVNEMLFKALITGANPNTSLDSLGRQ
ncbi:hypothetical protein ACX2QB_05950 [Weissella viridescens]